MDEREAGASLPSGYVEQAVAEILAGAEPGRLGSAATERLATAEPVRFCPGCGARLTEHSLVQEFWVAAESRFLVWCRSCAFTGTVVRVDRFETSEMEE